MIFDPGTHYKYGLGHDILAAVVEVASGMRFGEYLQKNIFEPLGMKDTGFTLTDEQKARVATQYRLNPATKQREMMGLFENPFRFGPEYESGGAGLYSTVTIRYFLQRLLLT